MGDFTLKNNLSDICEVGANRKLCWEGKSEFQHSLILDHKQFGRQLFLDCMMQSSTAEEFFYHEASPELLLLLFLSLSCLYCSTRGGL